MKIKVLRNFGSNLLLEVTLYAESIFGIRLVIRVILGELWAVEVVKITSADSSTCPVDKSS